MALRCPRASPLLCSALVSPALTALFPHAQKAASNKAKKQKEGKTFLEVEFTSRPPRRDTRERESTRGGRPSRGRGEGRGRGGARGGAPRGAPRSAAPAVPDASAFPALA